MENIETKVFEFLKGIGTIILYFAVSLIVSYLFRNLTYHENVVIATIFQTLSYVILLSVLILVYHKRLWHDFKNFKKEYVGVALKNWIIGLGAMMIANIIISNFVGTSVSVNEDANRVLLASYPISSVISMVILGPLIEEITFRASFKKAFSKWYTFALVTGLVFGAMHIQSFLVTKDFTELLYLLPYSTLGFFFAKAYYETDNIFTSYLSHVFHNGLCVILLIILFMIGG